MLFDDLRGVVHEAIDHVRRHRKACAVPDVEDVWAPVHVPGAARSSVGFDDAVEEGISVRCVKHVAAWGVALHGLELRVGRPRLRQGEVHLCAQRPIRIVGQVPREWRHQVKVAVVEVGGPNGHFERHHFVLYAHACGARGDLDPQPMRIWALPRERLPVFIGGFDAVDVLHRIPQGVGPWNPARKAEVHAAGWEGPFQFNRSQQAAATALRGVCVKGQPAWHDGLTAHGLY